MRIRVVDAFTDRAFAGNPAGVCVVERWPDAPWMQRVAAELNLSETAFARARPDGDWDLRWFTPTVEVDLCGHATLATAHALAQDGVIDDVVGLHTRSAVRVGDEDVDFVSRVFLPSVGIPEDPVTGGAHTASRRSRR